MGAFCQHIFVLFLWLGNLSLFVKGVIVDTKYGQVQGQTLELHNGKSVNTYYNIPFTKPPVGALRWQPPEEPDPWADIYIADKLGAACPQLPVGAMSITHPTWTNYDEDCLSLNIVTPADKSGGPYPVMLWIFGGGFSQGANFQYPGHFLAAKDVVVVLTNYRLGILGFASTMDEAAPGNYGHLDQLMAMNFVQDNIANFSGDPNKVTIFGESAGAASVGYMLVSPMSTGLFHQAILQSGSEINSWVTTADEHPEVYLKDLAAELNCTTDDNYEMMDCLRNKTVTELKITSGNCTGDGACGFGPVVDGPGGFLPELPLDLKERGDFHHVPEMLGYNREDQSLVTLAAHPSFIVRGPDREEFQNILNMSVIRAADGFPDPTRAPDVYAAMDFYYSPWPHIEDRDKLRQGIVERDTDQTFGAPGDIQIKLHVDYAPVYSFVFGFISTSNYSLVPDWLGCCHIMELPYVFGYPFLNFNEHVRNETEIVDVVLRYDDLDVEYAEFMTTLWTNFAKYGNPTPLPVEAPQNYGAVKWNEFTFENLDYILVSNDAVEVRQGYHQQEYAFWNEYLEWLVQGYGSNWHLDDGVIPSIFKTVFGDDQLYVRVPPEWEDYFDDFDYEDM